LKKILVASVLLLTLAILVPRSAYAWSNGGYSWDPYNPPYGTHDWIAQHALDWLPPQEKQFILDQLAVYRYGTELPDNAKAGDGIGDTAKHHVYYRSDGSLQDDSAAIRANETYRQASAYLRAGAVIDAAKWAGTMSHYIADLAVFGHVMGDRTDWGAETHHSDYEDYVNARTSSYNAEFTSYLKFDGALDATSAYDAAVKLAYDTTFDVDGDLTCIWMDQHYNWSDPSFRDRCGESLNLAVNYLADVLHTLQTKSSSTKPADHIVINEVELNPPGEDRGNEWAELYNPEDSAVEIGGWTLSTTHGETVTLTIPAGASIPARGYYSVTYAKQWLDNEGESIILRDSGGREIDRVGPFNDEKNDGRAWQRYPDGADTWVFEPSTRKAVNIPEFPVAAMILPVMVLLLVMVLRVRLLHKRNRVP